eukprot:12913215-Prorocentrum_lima.AAC.1
MGDRAREAEEAMGEHMEQQQHSQIGHHLGNMVLGCNGVPLPAVDVGPNAPLVSPVKASAPA